LPPSQPNGVTNTTTTTSTSMNDNLLLAKYRICEYCKREAVVQRCSRCKVTLYCSKSKKNGKRRRRHLNYLFLPLCDRQGMSTFRLDRTCQEMYSYE
jgi:hypothetical protein